MHWKSWLAFGLLFFVPLLLVSQAQEPTGQPVFPHLAEYPWIFLRNDQPLDDTEGLVEAIFVGDILCGRGGASQGLSLNEVSLLLMPANLAVGNLECVITAGELAEPIDFPIDKNQPYSLWAKPQQANWLREAGFDLLGVANNHTLDLSAKGLAETIQYMKQSGMRAVGYCEDPACEDAAIIYPAGDLRIAFVSLNLISSPSSSEREDGIEGIIIAGQEQLAEISSRLQSLKSTTQAVVVSVHWGSEYETRTSPAQREIAQALVSAGADLVIGHHPHVPQQVEIFTNPENQSISLVAYSLGNFIADQQFGETTQGLAIRAFFDKNGLRAAQMLPLHTGPVPRLLPLSEAAQLLERTMPEPEAVFFACHENDCFESQSPQSAEVLPQSGLFWSGSVDLTGDGVPEQIQRQQSAVKVFHDGQEVWQTPVNWQVVDLALGDPDDDGRNEMMMAFWRPDKMGLLRSHPFIIGFRGGTYHETWGGSGVSDPILEVELGDVDGDSIQELVVLEQRENTNQAVTVWDWHGWGFSLKWRSPEDHYESLRIVPDLAGGNPLIRIFRSRIPFLLGEKGN